MRFPGQWPAKGRPTSDLVRARLSALDYIRNRGTPRVPHPPRDVILQSGPRGVFVTWGLPIDSFDVVGYRVYKGDETSLYTEIRDRGNRQVFVESTAGSPSVTTNIFISSMNALGQESNPVQVQGKALTESGAPVMPGVPPGYNNGSGMNKSNKYGKFSLPQ